MIQKQIDEKLNGEIGPSYTTFLDLVGKLKNESIIMLQVTETDFFTIAEHVVNSS